MIVVGIWTFVIAVLGLFAFSWLVTRLIEGAVERISTDDGGATGAEAVEHLLPGSRANDIPLLEISGVGQERELGVVNLPAVVAEAVGPVAHGFVAHACSLTPDSGRHHTGSPRRTIQRVGSTMAGLGAAGGYLSLVLFPIVWLAAPLLTMGLALGLLTLPFELAAVRRSIRPLEGSPLDRGDVRADWMRGANLASLAYAFAPALCVINMMRSSSESEEDSGGRGPEMSDTGGWGWLGGLFDDDWD